MPCGCFGGGTGVGKKDGDKYGPKGKANDESKVQLITTKPPVIEPIPEPTKKAAVQSSAPPAAPAKGGSSPTGDGTRREADDPDKANRRRDVVASYYSDECELLTYKNTSSRPTSQVGEDGEASPPAATSSPVPSSPASSRSAASTRADLAEKRREFFKPLVEDTKEPPWTGNLRQPLIDHDLVHPHAQPLLEKHNRQLENFKEPTVKDVVNKFEHMPEQTSSSKLETEVILGKNSSTTVTVVQNKEMRIAQKPVSIITHKDEVKLTPEQEIQEKQLVNKASVHQQLLGGQANLRHTPAPKPREIPAIPPPVTVTVPDQPHNDDCIIQSATTPEVDWSTPVPAKPPREPSLSDPRNFTESAPVITESETFADRPKSIVEEPKSIVEEPKSIVEEPKLIVEEPKSIVEEPKSIVEEPKSIVEEPKSIVEEPKSIVEEPKPVVVEPKPVVEEPKPVVEEPKPVVEEPKPVVEEPKPVVEEPKPVVEEPKPVVEEPISIVEESKVVAESQPFVKDVNPIVEPEPIVAGHESENIVDLEHVQQSIESIEKTETLIVSEKLSDTETDITNSKSLNTIEISQTKDSRTIEPTFAAEDVSFISQETDLISVLEENKKNILSSQSEQIPVDIQPKSSEEIIHSDQSFIIESKSINNETPEMFSQIENSMNDSPQDKFDNGATSEERISINSKEGPIAVDLAKELLADMSDSKNVEVKTTDDGTMHTQTTKSVETDEDGNVIMHTRTIKTTTIGSSEPMSEMMADLADNWSKPIMDVQSTDDGTMHTQTTKSTVTDEDGNTITHTRTIKSTTISSSDPMSEILSTEAFMTEPLSDINSAFISESSSAVADKSSESLVNDVPHHNDDQKQQSDIQSTLQSSLSPLTQVGSSPTPSSTPSPRNSIHSSPPASPDSPRAQKVDKVELQHEQEPLAQQLKQDTQESLPVLTPDQLSQEEKSTNNLVLNKDAKINGPPSPSIESRNPLTCNEADITAPTSQEDDGLGSEIDDALDNDLLSEETNSHSLQHHHQSVPAPPPPSSAS